MEVCGVLSFLLLSAAPLLELEAERHPRGDVVEGQRVPVLQHIANNIFTIRSLSNSDPDLIGIQWGQWFWIRPGIGIRIHGGQKGPPKKAKRKFCVKKAL
jgi:hypothetical protein